MDLKIRFIPALDPSRIVNLCSPDNTYVPRDWDDQSERQRASELKAQYIDLFNKINSFYRNLEDSVRRDGIRNPVILTTGSPRIKPLDWVPPERRDNLVCCEIIGGSRVYTAQKLGVTLPAIVNDFANAFPEAKLLKTEDEVRDCFYDPPKNIYLTNEGVKIGAVGENADQLRRIRSMILRNIYI